MRHHDALPAALAPPLVACSFQVSFKCAEVGLPGKVYGALS
jgi:hypothetical protein